MSKKHPRKADDVPPMAPMASSSSSSSDQPSKSLRDSFRDLAKNLTSNIKDKIDEPQKIIDIFIPSEVVRAVEKGDLVNVQRAFAAGQIKLTDEKWLTLAIKNHQVEVARFFLREGASPNVSSGDITLLEWAALSRKKELVDDLVQHGASLTQRDQKNQATILHKMAEQGRIDLLWSLVDQGADVMAETQSGMTPLMILVSRGEYAEIEKALLQRPELKTLLLSANQTQQRSLLQHALLNEKYDAALWLLSLGADPEHQDHLGKTALHYAARGRSLPVLQAILAKMKNVNGCDHDGGNAILEALLVPNRAFRVEILEMLLKAGVELTPYGPEKIPLLSIAIAVLPKDIQKIEVLLSHGADIGARDCNGYAPFHLALQKMGTKELLGLLKYDCDVNQSSRDMPEKPLLVIAQDSERNRYDKRTLLAAFIAAGARMEARNSAGENIFDCLQKDQKAVFERKEMLALYHLVMKVEAEKRARFFKKNRP